MADRAAAAAAAAEAAAAVAAVDASHWRLARCSSRRPLSINNYFTQRASAAASCLSRPQLAACHATLRNHAAGRPPGRSPPRSAQLSQLRRHLCVHYTFITRRRVTTTVYEPPTALHCRLNQPADGHCRIFAGIILPVYGDDTSRNVQIWIQLCHFV